ncbi:response regulator [Actinokineospora cianjurensis]|uniref:Response regulator receiver domain-containing protein n=1 Tax=Actinokineospora cianjurensis TaxID=585224 RepID=A0A421B3D6_9PSEU|nr:response regulator [Actinokineospora cianjurensis]RLK58889.1 response regulator receiver domain-containing protein [Actinokineospora cianjurensis]
MDRADSVIDDNLVLVVEDSEVDREAIDRALSRSHPELVLEFLPDGNTVLDRLRDQSRPRPSLMFLDLSMPGVDGYGVLSSVRADTTFADLTIIVLTSSTTSADIDRCYAAGADSYIYKPVNFALFRTVLQGAVDYWHSLPPSTP